MALWIIDSEGDRVCRHCKTTPVFDHFKECPYRQDRESDDYVQNLQRKIRELSRELVEADWD